jgi:hypothetical protein
MRHPANRCESARMSESPMAISSILTTQGLPASAPLPLHPRPPTAATFTTAPPPLPPARLTGRSGAPTAAPVCNALQLPSSSLRRRSHSVGAGPEAQHHRPLHHLCSTASSLHHLCFPPLCHTPPPRPHTTSASPPPTIRPPPPPLPRLPAIRLPPATAFHGHPPSACHASASRGHPPPAIRLPRLRLPPPPAIRNPRDTASAFRGRRLTSALRSPAWVLPPPALRPPVFGRCCYLCRALTSVHPALATTRVDLLGLRHVVALQQWRGDGCAADF